MPSSSSTSCVLIYRLVAIVDAYRVAEYLNTTAASGAGQAGRARVPRNVAVDRRPPGDRPGHDRQPCRRRALRHPRQGRPRQRLHLHQRPEQGVRARRLARRPARRSRRARAMRPPCRPTPPYPRGPRPAARVPEVAIPPWDGKERLNILLIGADQRPNDGTFNTDTLIVVSIDPLTKQVAMFSLPRDTVDVPIPPGPCPDDVRLGLSRQDQRLVDEHPPSIRFLPGDQEDSRLQRAQGHPRQPLQARHQVLRRGQLRRLPEHRRRDGRGDHQRPGPGLGRPLPVDRGHACDGSTSRAGSST